MTPSEPKWLLLAPGKVVLVHLRSDSPTLPSSGISLQKPPDPVPNTDTDLISNMLPTYERNSVRPPQVMLQRLSAHSSTDTLRPRAGSHDPHTQYSLTSLSTESSNSCDSAQFRDTILDTIPNAPGPHGKYFADNNDSDNYESHDISQYVEHRGYDYAPGYAVIPNSAFSGSTTIYSPESSSSEFPSK